jgi:hypothetical protein
VPHAFEKTSAPTAIISPAPAIGARARICHMKESSGKRSTELSNAVLALANSFQLDQTNDQPSTIHISDDQCSL